MMNVLINMVFLFGSLFLLSFIWLLIFAIIKKSKKIPLICCGCFGALAILSFAVGMIAFPEPTGERISSNNATEYLYADFYELKDKFWDLYETELNKMNSVEIHGIYNNEEEANKNYMKASDKCAKKVFEQFELKPGQPIIISGYLVGVREISEDSFFRRNGYSNKIAFSLYSEPKNKNSAHFISCQTNDDRFLNMEDNTPIKIMGLFVKEGCSGVNTDLFDCEIIEN